jgi:acetoacetyl-CoA synthetase
MWHPPSSLSDASNLRAYMRWLARERNLIFDDYSALWQWSVEQLEDFWGSLWDYFGIRATPIAQVLADDSMPGARWFTGARLNYAEYAFRAFTSQVRAAHEPAILFRTETTTTRPETTEMSWGGLFDQVASLSAWLRQSGVGMGDRVAAYVPNMPEAVVAFLACASIGAVWSSCSPDIGAAAVIDRFRQIEPKVLFAVDGYIYNGKPNDRRAVVAELMQALPTLSHVVHIPYLFDTENTDDTKKPTNSATTGTSTGMRASISQFPNLVTNQAQLMFEQVSFDHPLWVLYSSGTTGLPKPIVHSQGGILIEHLKAITFHLDLKPNDRFFWFTTTGWMMWNFLVGGLLVGSTIVLYDGSPGRNDMHALWQFAADVGITIFGTSAAYITACAKANLVPRQYHDLSRLRHIGSTGSPLSEEGFRWVYDAIDPNIWLGPMSGGTDVCTAFVGGNPLLPVNIGEMQCRYLGVKLEAFDEAGHAHIDDVGELVITRPMPSMPIYFWNDPDMQRYRESYFDIFPGVWRHGDWVKVTATGGIVIYGRSDSTINRQGVRMGTSEVYRVVDAVPEVLDALVIDLEMLDRPSRLWLFVVLRADARLDDALVNKIKLAIRTGLSPRQVPDDVIQIDEVPRTLNGKKLEVPVKKILLGMPISKAVNMDSVANPMALEYFAKFANGI